MVNFPVPKGIPICMTFLRARRKIELLDADRDPTYPQKSCVVESRGLLGTTTVVLHPDI